MNLHISTPSGSTTYQPLNAPAEGPPGANFDAELGTTHSEEDFLETASGSCGNPTTVTADVEIGAPPATDDLGHPYAGEGGAAAVTNAQFIDSVFSKVPEGAVVVACSKAGDPTHGSWDAMLASKLAERAPAETNNYVGCSSFYVYSDGSVRAKKERFASCHAFMLDDVGTKVSPERLAGIELSWLIETSPGNHQGGIILADPITDAAEAKALHDAIIEAKLCDPGASGPAGRWARTPVGVNGKPKHSKAGEPFRCRLVEWRPDRKYTAQQIIDGLGLTLKPRARPKALPPPAMAPKGKSLVACAAQQVLTARPDENPVATRLKARGQYKKLLGEGKHDITCPWVDEHTDAVDGGTAYFEPSDAYPLGGFCCQHSHREQYHIGELLVYLGMSTGEAQHRPVIRVVEGKLAAVVEAAELELARTGRFFQSGGLIVSVDRNSETGDPRTVPTNKGLLTLALSEAVAWERPTSKGWAPCDPPTTHVGILLDSQAYKHLPRLVGLARQPYFREHDRELVTDPGYDPVSQRYAVFDPAEYALPEPTFEAAQAAHEALKNLLAEFHFAGPTDQVAAMSAIFTAVVRPTLPHAPAFHVRAPVMGSGKSYLCELIAAFAGPGGSANISYPMTGEEASKVILALLLTKPAVVEFDDMATPWLAHSVVKRVLTSTHITERVLGVSKAATVGTGALFLGSGNNVGPSRDLLRRVLTIHLDARCATPATIAYKGSPVERVRRNRGTYVSLVLTIIRAWLRAGSPRADVGGLATYGGAWSDLCRHTLMWLGNPDPATVLLAQIKSDPEAEAHGALLVAWYAKFGSAPTPLRNALEPAGWSEGSDLLEAIRDIPDMEQGGGINRSKFGRYLSRHENKIVRGLKLQKVDASERTAWRVVQAEPSPASPPSPLLGAADLRPMPGHDAVDLGHMGELGYTVPSDRTSWLNVDADSDCPF